jgi:hypothetical protein
MRRAIGLLLVLACSNESTGPTRAEMHPSASSWRVGVAALARSGEELASVFIAQFNFCTFEGFFTQSDDVAPTVFRTSGNLSSARLEATIPTRIEGDGVVQVQVDLTWTGSGALEVTGGGSISIDPEDPSSCKFVFADQTTLRQATATGTVSIGSVNYTPAPSVSGVLGRSTTSTIAVQC